MRVLIYSDVHGNLPALEEVLKAAGECDWHISLGDLVNYGPWADECVDLALSLKNSVCIMGNHEISFIKNTYPGSNKLVEKFFEHSIGFFNRFQEIKNFKEEYSISKYICKHTYLQKYIYHDTSVELDNNYFIGHSHHQFEYKNSGFILYNSGSVGQNRKILRIANYLIYDTENDKVFMKHVEYNPQIIIDKMKSLKYPKDCIDYYLSKMI